MNVMTTANEKKIVWAKTFLRCCHILRSRRFVWMSLVWSRTMSCSRFDSYGSWLGVIAGDLLRGDVFGQIGICEFWV